MAETGLEINLDTRRGAFHLNVQMTLSASLTVIFGPSGAGKSTLLRLLAGLDRPDHGRIVHNGQVLTDTATRTHISPGTRRCALVTQQPALFPHMRVGANVSYGIKSQSASESTRRVEEALELVGASDLLRRSPAELSGGEAQRVALARALVVQPKLLLLDEPFSALDGAAADGLLERLQTWLADHDVQTVMVTHDATDAFITGAEVVLLRDGRPDGQGPAGEVLAAERARLARHLGSI